MDRTNWVAVCDGCGIKTYGSPYMTVEQAKVWANGWLKEHRKVCSERKTGSEKEA